MLSFCLNSVAEEALKPLCSDPAIGCDKTNLSRTVLSKVFKLLRIKDLTLSVSV